MKKSRLVLIALGIVAFLGLIDRVNCRKEQVYMPQETEIKRIELKGGYMIIQTGPVRRVFQYDSKSNSASLSNIYNNTHYIDEGCDGLVDRIHLNGWYQRENYGKEEMFKEADKYFEKAKKEMGANDIK